MPLTAQGTLLQLRRSQFLRLRHPRGVQLAVRRGTLWITLDGDPRDIEVGPGETFGFDTGATVVVGALGTDAELALRLAAPAPTPGWLAWARSQPRLEWLCPAPATP
jgi:hypothetical protein